MFRSLKGATSEKRCEREAPRNVVSVGNVSSARDAISVGDAVKEERCEKLHQRRML